MASITKDCQCADEIDGVDAKMTKWTECSKLRPPHKWVVRWREPGVAGRRGRQKEASFTKLKDAESHALKVERDKELGGYISPDKVRTPLLDVWAQYLSPEGGAREGITAKNYESIGRIVIRGYPGWQTARIGAVQPGEIEAWMNWMRHAKPKPLYAESTVLNRFDVLSAMFNFAVRNGYRQDNPCNKVLTKRAAVERQQNARIDIPDIEELELLAAALPGEYRAVLWLMAGCGLRIGEALAVTRSQLNFTVGFLNVNRQIAHDKANSDETDAHIASRGKGRGMHVRNVKWRGRDEGRAVPLSEHTGRILRSHLKSYGTHGPEKYLFGNMGRTNVPAIPWWRKEVWRKAVLTSGVEKEVRPHWCRHYFISMSLFYGVPVTDIAEWVGHRNPQLILKRYRHLTKNSADQGRRAIDAALSGMLHLPPELRYVLEGDGDDEESTGSA